MKKRTLVCFLIFILCVLQSSIPGTVFGQEEELTPEQLAEKVFEAHKDTLVIDAVNTLLPEVFEELVKAVKKAEDSGEELDIPATIQLALIALNAGLDDTVKETAAAQGIELTDAHIALLKRQDVQALLNDELTKKMLGLNAADLEVALTKLKNLVDAYSPTDDQEPPTISIITPSTTTEQQGSYNVVFTTADANGDTVTVTGTISVEPVAAASYYSIPSGTLTGSVMITQTTPTTEMPTIPGATVTLTLVANDGTADSSPATYVVEFAAAEKAVEPPDPPGPPDKPDPPILVPSNLNGESRLGGLSLNRIHGRSFIRELIAAAGLDTATADALVEPAVEFLLAQIPIGGIIPEETVRQNLTSRQAFSVFADEPPGLDFENFGNGITPTLSEALYAHEDTPNTSKFSTRDNINVYVRVPSTLEDGKVQFRMNGSEAKLGQRIAPDIFQSDTIPYTFRLEETLAATNLPAWPDLGNQLFSEVVLRYSQEGLDEQYIALDMAPVRGDKGVVWEGDVGIIPGRNVFYYFEVTLVEPVKLEIVNRDALAEALFSPDGTTTLPASREYIIESWSMPDPRNLQLAQRGIFDALFTDDVVAEITRLAVPLIAAGDPTITIPGQELRRLQQLLLRNTSELTNNFESNFDPMLASVFTVPNIDTEIESLWFANLDSMEDGEYTLEAVVYNADGEAVDHIAVAFETDTSAPEADITVSPANADTTGYLNKDGVYVSTAPIEGTSSLLNIIGSTTPDEVGVDEGYLLYQIIELDDNGNPEGTWLPLTIEASILSSDIWDLINERFPSSLDDSFKIGVPGTDVEIDIRNFALRTLLGFLESGVPGVIEAQDLQALISDQLRGLLGIELSNNQYALLTDLLGAVIDDIDLIPFTFDPERTYKFPIQGSQLPLLVGDYGVRAMGIDPVLNVGSHVAPTRIRIVPYQYDRSSITMAALGDINKNGNDDAYEFGVLYDNARDVTLTITIDERTVHPLNHDPEHPNASIVVYYMDAEGVWQSVGNIELVEGEGAAGDTRTIEWEVGDTFDDLVMAGDAVMLRSVTTNALQHPIDINSVDFDALTDDQDLRISDPFTINLDPDVFPVDPVVLVVDVDPDSINMTNQDSGAPQGTIKLEGYTPRRTVPATDTIRIEVMRPSDDAPIMIGEVVVNDPAGMDGGVTEAIMFKGKTLAEVYVDHTLHIDSTSSYLKWIITVDTTLLDDTITVDSPAARDASLDENRYMVRAYAVGADGNDISPVLMGDDYTEQFSVDNDDDVTPLGPTDVAINSIDNVNAIDPVFVDNGDGTYTVGGLVDKYDPNVPSPVITLTLEPTAMRHTYDGVKLLTTLPEGAVIGDVTETAEGSGIFTVTIDVGTLADDDDEDYNDKYLQNHYKDPYDLMYNPTEEDVYSFQVHALTYDNAEPYDDATAADEVFLEYGNIQADEYDGDEITINVENSYRPDPGVIAITVDNTENTTFNPDSGAPQGELMFNVYTYYITSPPTEGIRVEVQRPNDPTRERITGTAVDPVEVDISEIPGVADLDDITGGLVGITQAGTLSGDESVVEIPTRFMKWTYIVDTRALALEDTVTADDTIKLDDTISRGDDSQRDVSLDENMYTVYAISLTPKNKAHPEYAQRDGVEASFSLDNVDDVPPLGPTNITDVADHVGSIEPNEDGSYTARGIVDDAVESTILTFSIAPTAEPITYANGKIGLVQTAPDGTVSHVEGSLDDGYITVDIGMLENGAYTYYALVGDEFGNWQDHENEVASPIITVHVLNFRVSDIMELMVTSVDGMPVEGELPDPIPLRDSIAVSFNVNNDTLFVEDLIGVVVGGQFRDGDDYTAGSDGENAFMLSANNLMELPSQHTTPHGRIEIRERFVDFPLANINLDNTAPVITFVTPTEGATVNNLPTLHAEYNDGDLGVGISADNTAVVSLDRLRPDEVVQDSVSIDVDQNMVEQDMESVVYTRIDKLAGGAYQFTVMVTDSLGNVGKASVNFAVEGIDPTVVITAPASGQEFDASPGSVTGFFAGGGDVGITEFTVNGEDVSESVSVDGNNFTYSPEEGFGDDSHTVSVEVTDGSGLTAQTSLTFIVDHPIPTATIATPTAGQEYSHGMPIITGTFSGADPVAGTLSIDGEVVMDVSGNEFTYKPTEALSDGDHTVMLMVSDVNGNTAEAMTEFTINIPGPSVVIHSPAGGQMYDHGTPEISWKATGAAEIASVTLTINGDAVELADGASSYTPDSMLGDGEYTAVVTATDANGKSAEATVVFSVFHPEPTVSIQSPTAGGTYDHEFSHIAGEFSGVGDIAVSLMVDGEEVEAMKNGNQFTAELSEKLSEGDHMVTVTVTSENGKTAQASASFSVVYPEATVSISSPVAGDTYDHTYGHISGSFMGVGEVSVTLMVDGEEVVPEVDQENNTFTHDLSDKLSEGSHTVSVSVEDANGETAEASTTFSVVYPEASVSISSPVAGDTYDHTYGHISGSFMGVGEVSVTLMVDGEALEAMVEGNSFSHNLADKLSEGSHTVSVSVMDSNGETAEASTTFSVVYPEASVSISSPVAGDTYDHTYGHISGSFMGVGEVSVTLMVDGEAVEAMVEGNAFSHTLSEKLSEGDHTVSVSVEDANGETAEASTTFSVVYPEASVSISSPVAGDTYDHTYGHISGSFMGVGEVSVTLMVDGEAVEAMVEGNAFSHTLSEKLSEGDHTVSVSVEDANGETAEASTTFSVVYPEASVSISSPVAGDTYDHTYGHISGSFMGVGEVSVTLMLDGEAVEAMVEGNEFTHNLADKLSEGSHTVSASVMDSNGETAEASTTFSVVYPEASVSISSPVAGDTYDHTYGHISGSFMGVGEVSVTLMLDGEAVEAMVEGNEFTHNLADKLSEGSHTVSASVMDSNGETAEASTTFSVVYPEASVSISSPVAGDTYDHTYGHISGSFMGVGEVSVTLMVDGEALEAMVEGNSFSHNLADKLSEGSHTVSVSVMDSNGETAEASTTFSVVYPEPTVTIQSPVAGHTYDNGSIILNGEFTGVGDVTVKLTVGGENVDVAKDGNQFSGEVELLHGTYNATAEVTDANGKSAKTSVDFIVDIPGPSVAILSPAAGQTYYQGKPVIRGYYSGMTEVEVTTFTINGEDASVVVEEEDQQFTYTPADDLSNGEYILMVEVTDENDKTAQATVVFNVMLDTTPPVISEVGPSGTVKDSWVNISAVITDEQSDILSVEFYIRDENDVNKAFVPFVSSVDPGPANHRITADKIKNGQIEISDSFEPGTHTMQVIAESLGGTTVHTWSFTVVIDNIAPIITSITPSGTIHRGLPTISASANDASGVAEIVITVMDDNGEEVTGETMDDAEADVTGITRLDFMPENPLDEGSYSIEVRATDTNGNSSSAKGVFTVDFDTAAPIITSSSPQDGARLIYKQKFNKQTGDDEKENGRPTISLTFGDAETGVNVNSIELVIEAPKKGGGTLVAPIDLTDDQKSATQVLYTLSSPVFPDGHLEPGEYKVKLEVSDNAHQQGNVTEDNDGARKANTAVYHFSFFVEYSDAPILAVNPYNHPNPFKDKTRISFTLNRTSTVSIVIYDVTLRPVRVLKDSEVMSPGNYIGRHGTEWDGKADSGVDLARGIYFCEIVVNDGVEPEYAILKLALTR